MHACPLIGVHSNDCIYRFLKEPVPSTSLSLCGSSSLKEAVEEIVWMRTRPLFRSHPGRVWRDWQGANAEHGLLSGKRGKMGKSTGWGHRIWKWGGRETKQQPGEREDHPLGLPKVGLFLHWDGGAWAMSTEQALNWPQKIRIPQQIPQNFKNVD